MARKKYEGVSLANYIYYSFLEIYMRFSLQFFFRRLKIVGRENVSTTRPVIFTGNHQSAFIDPILTAAFSKRRPWFITRAGVFNNAFARAFFNSVHMLPIFRMADKVNIAKANEATFKKSRALLTGHGSILIFPEGNHGMRKRLRTPLKKGFARMAFQAEEECDFKLGIDIIPTGIFYEHPTKFRSDCFLKFGKPLNTKDYVDLYKKDPNQAYKKIADDLAMAMAKNLINIQPLDSYDELEKTWHLARPKESDLEKRYNSDRDITERLKNGEQLNPTKKSKKVGTRLIFGVLGLPFFIYGALNNLIGFLLAKWVLKTKIKDPHFYHSIMFSIGVIVIPLVTMLQAIVVQLIFNNYNITLLYFFITPFMGLLAYDYYDIVFRGEVRPAATKLMQGFGH